MRLLKQIGLALVAMFALAAVAVSSASAALPLVSVTLGEAFPAVASAESGAAALSTALSSPITATSVKIKITFPATGTHDEGTYVADFEGALFEKEQCNTAGDADGVILVEGKINLVVALNAAKTGNQFAGAFTVPTGFEVLCGPLGKPKIKIPVTGIAIGAIEGVEEGKDLTAFKGNLKCTKANNGKQELKEYKNEAGTFEKHILSANLGLGNETACEEVSNIVSFTSNKMIEFVNIK